MKFLFEVVCLYLLSAGPQCAACQARFESGPERGFSRAVPEHIIREIKVPFRVRKVSGVVHLAVSDKGPMERVLFEVRGPGQSDRVTGTYTNKNGEFSFKRLKPGTYRFKVTFSGFQSQVGTIIVDQAAEKAEITIAMEPGV